VNSLRFRRYILFNEFFAFGKLLPKCPTIFAGNRFLQGAPFHTSRQSSVTGPQEEKRQFVVCKAPAEALGEH
jgi:hypothetical protein